MAADCLLLTDHCKYLSTLFVSGINSEVRYSLQGPDSSFFSLDETSGVLRLERPLTDEAQTTFELKVKATDRGLPRHLNSFSTVTVTVVDLSDYQPVFVSSEYSTSIPESIAVGTEVLSVSAGTRDGVSSEPIVYTIVAGNDGGRFQINPQTGRPQNWLTLFLFLSFDSPNNNLYFCILRLLYEPQHQKQMKGLKEY